MEAAEGGVDGVDASMWIHRNVLYWRPQHQAEEETGFKELIDTASTY